MTTEPAAYFDTETLPDDVRAEAWREFMSFPVVPFASPNEPFRAWQRQWRGPKLEFRHNYVSGHLARYTTARRQNDSLVLSYKIKGSTRAWQDGSLCESNPGELLLLDANKTDAFGLRHSETIAVTLPYPAVAFEPNAPLTSLRFKKDTMVARLFAGVFASLLNDDLIHQAQDRDVLDQTIASFVRTLILQREPDDQDRALLRPARQGAIRRYIEQHLDDPTLDAPHLRATFRVSSATVARDFAEEGGVSRYITRRRLERSLHELTSRAPQRGDIARAAARSGYSDPAHFSRVFRRSFGFTPSDAAALGEISAREH